MIQFFSFGGYQRGVQYIGMQVREIVYEQSRSDTMDPSHYVYVIFLSWVLGDASMYCVVSNELIF